MPHKVTFDTNILFAGSIVETTGELGFPIKHKFYDYAINLIQYIARNPAKRIGITTNFIETEAYKTLSEAVETELVESEYKKHVQDIEKEHDVFSALLNRCNDNMGKIFIYLIKEPVDENAVDRIYYNVDYFYDEMKNDAKGMIENLKIQGDMRHRTTSGRYKFMMRTYSQQDRWPYAQLLNLIVYKDVEPNDKRILSEVIYLHRIYKTFLGTDLKSYIASTDYHFSPIRDDGRTSSSYITDRIKRRYDIICNWPDEIYNLIKK